MSIPAEVFRPPLMENGKVGVVVSLADCWPLVRADRRVNRELANEPSLPTAEVAAEMTDLKRDELARLLDPASLTQGGIKGGGG